MKNVFKNIIKKLFSFARALRAFFSRILLRFGPREKYIVGLALLILAASVIALGVQFYINKTDVVPAEGGAYREATIGSPRFINPVLAATNDVDRDLVRLIYPALMRYNKTGELVPELAEKMEVLDGGKKYQFTLRENAVWEDGKPLTVEDVIFTIERIQDPQYASPLYQSWQGVTVTSEEKIITFTLTIPYKPFLENTTVGILPKHIWQETTPKNFALSGLNLQPLGGGPYRIEKFVKDDSGFISSYTLKRNDRYYNKKPYIDQITLRFYNTEDEAIRALNSGAVDGISFLSAPNIKRLQSPELLALHELSMPRYFAIFFNPANGSAAQEKSVRTALGYATNRSQLINNILGGYGREEHSPIPTSLINYSSNDITKFSYDADKARSILAEAGWNDNDGDGLREKKPKGRDEAIRLEFNLATVNQPELELVAEAVQKQWKEVGVGLAVQTIDLGELQQNVIRPRAYDLLLFGEMLGSIPDPFSFWHSSQKNDPGLNLANFENSDINALLERGRREADETARINIYKEFQKKLTLEAPVIFLYNPTYIYPVHKRVRGIEPALIADTAQRFFNVTEWYIETKRSLSASR